MATSSRSDMVGNISQLLALFKGSPAQTTIQSGGETTQKTTLDADAVTAMLNSILGGNQGLAAVSGGQKSAGLYNSSVNTQLTNDLLARAAAAVAEKQSTTTTTKAPTTQTQQTAGQLDLGKTLLTGAATYLGNKVIKKSGIGDAVDKSVDSASRSIGEVLGVGGGSGGDIGSVIGRGYSDSLSGALDNGSSVFNAADFIGGSPDFISSADSIFDYGGTTAYDYIDSSSSIDDLGSIFNSGGYTPSGFDLASAGFDIAGDVINGDTTQIAGDALGGSVFGDFLGAASVICTELHRQGIMSNELYSKELTNYVGKVPASAVVGYHFWGVPYAALMSRSALATKIAKPFAFAWATHLNGGKSVLGKILWHVGVPVCSLIGKIVLAKDKSNVIYN
jgi:hypothetical protein